MKFEINTAISLHKNQFEIVCKFMGDCFVLDVSTNEDVYITKSHRRHVKR